MIIWVKQHYTHHQKIESKQIHSVHHVSTSIWTSIVCDQFADGWRVYIPDRRWLLCFFQYLPSQNEISTGIYRYIIYVPPGIYSYLVSLGIYRSTGTLMPQIAAGLGWQLDGARRILHRGEASAPLSPWCRWRLFGNRCNCSTYFISKILSKFYKMS